MDVVVSRTRDETGKLAAIVEACDGLWHDGVLDVGCRSGALRELLPAGAGRYTGLDVAGRPDVLATLDAPLPFATASFGVVTALDVLEHTNGFHAAFAELCRVAAGAVVVTLPNAFFLPARLRFARGRVPNGKYGLPLEPPEDRHRWLFSFSEARRFVHTHAARLGFSVWRDGALVGPRLARILAAPGMTSKPDLLCPWYLAVLSRGAARGPEGA